MDPTGPMAQLSSRNALLPRTILSSTIFRRQTKLALIGIILIYVSHETVRGDPAFIFSQPRNIAMGFGVLSFCTIRAIHNLAYMM
jgi:hypothetical protein